jgi:DNA replication licensing factor MCM4
LKSFDQDLYDELVAYPAEVIPVFDMAANDIFREQHPNIVLPHSIYVKPFNAEKTQNMRELSPEGEHFLLFLCFFKLSQ